MIKAEQGRMSLLIGQLGTNQRADKRWILPQSLIDLLADGVINDDEDDDENEGDEVEFDHMDDTDEWNCVLITVEKVFFYNK